MKYEKTWSIPFATFISWLIAGTEYLFRVPGNRVGFIQVRHRERERERERERDRERETKRERDI